MPKELYDMREVLRSEEMAEVVSGLGQGKWYVIYAPPASGKTTFLAQVREQLSREMRTCYINMRGCSGTITDAYQYLAGYIDPKSRAGNLLELRELLLAQSEKILLLVDDVASAGEEVARALLNALSALHAESLINPRLGRVSIVLAAGRDLQNLGQGMLSCLNTFEELFLRDFSLEELCQAIGHRGEEIWRWSEGHPWLSAYLAKIGFFHEKCPIDPIATQEIPLFNRIKLRLPELLEGYSDGTWQNFKRVRALRLSGVAKLHDGRLVVRNPIFRQLIEGTLMECGERISYQVENNSAQLLLNRESKEIYLAGKQVSTTPVEYRILDCLLSNSPRVLSKEMLAEAALPFEPVPSVDVESHIKNIRRKLQDQAKNPRYIRCRRGFGYQAVAGSFEFV